MPIFILACVLVLAGVFTAILGRKAVIKLSGILTIGVALIIVGFTAFTSIPAQSVGVQIQFGKPIHNFGPGLHWKSPWTTVVKMDGRTQTEIHTGDKRVEIRLGNQATGYVQNSLRWKIRPEAASNLYADYRDFEKIGPNLVDLELAAAMNAAFSDYDPLANIKAAAGDPTARVITNDQLADRVQQRLEQRIGARIIIEQVVISKVDFDDATQARINQLQQEIGNTRIAEQREKTAAADARANRTLAASVSKDPNVLVSKCLDQLAVMVDKGQTVPVGFTCWPTASQQPVIVNQSK